MMVPDGSRLRGASADGAGLRSLVGAASLAFDPSLDQAGPSDNWIRWTRTGLLPGPGPAPGVPGREETLKELAAAGASAVGLLVEWARVAPAPRTVDAGVVERYAELLAECGAAGLEPVVTLQHRTHPAWLGEELWLTPGAPDLFAEHVGNLVQSLGDLCRHWVTVLSPGRLARQGWVSGRVPPGRRGALADAYVVLDNLVTGHVLAAAAIRGARSDAVVAIGHHASDLYDEGPLALDLLGAGDRRLELEEVDGWLRHRRAEFDRLHPPNRFSEVPERAAVRLFSPFGRRASPFGRRGGVRLGVARLADSVRMPCPLRVLTEVAAPGARLGPDALVVVWDLPRRGASLIEWCRVEARRHDVPMWILAPGGGDGLMPSAPELATVRAAQSAGVPLDGWLRLAPGPLLLPES